MSASRQDDVAQVLHHHIGACHSQRLPVAPPIHADHASETTGAPCCHTGHGVFDHDGPSRLHLQACRCLEEDRRLRLAGETETGRLVAVHHRIKARRIDPGRPQDS